MVIAIAVCVLLAMAAVVDRLTLHQAWALPTFAGAIVAGFAAQIWFIVGLVRASKFEKKA
jgi:hypothetical protein